jgi:2,3-bisphosphoglycerate-independent phosphoglycerate mutase
MTEYKPEYQVEVAYPLEDAGSTVGQVISEAGLKQLRVTETEKFLRTLLKLQKGRSL